MYKIEKGIPVSGLTKGRRGSKYPFADMEVGDSFLLPCGDKERVKTMARVSCSITRQKVTGKLFTARSAEGGIRVWRTK